jgi:hypothetical protein
MRNSNVTISSYASSTGSDITHPPTRGLNPPPQVGSLYIHFNTSHPTEKPLIWIRQNDDNSGSWNKITEGFACPEDNQRYLGISTTGRPAWKKKTLKSGLHIVNEEDQDD